MERIEVRLGHKHYPLKIRRGLLDEIGEEVKEVYQGEKIAVITDENVDNYYGRQVIDNLQRAGFKAEKIIISPGEKSKSFPVLLKIYEFLAEMGITRGDLLLTLGGGVVGDLGGFAAATYLRGIPYVQVPTSLLAQIDSSIGGKVAVDLPQGKNLVGSFYQPEAVLIDPDLLQTLEARFFRDGLAEVIKYGCIKDRNLFFSLLNCPEEEDLLKDMESIIRACCQIKKDIVEKDEQDQGERMILNFGHTLGHALERYFAYEKYTHGEAVAAGMYMITCISEQLGMTKAGTSQKIKAILDKYKLPIWIEVDNWERLVNYIKLDKKKRGNRLKLIILKEIGQAEIIESSLDFFKEGFKLKWGG
ncbi:MAG TPA: 3-dehydroquinate synthase [Clostridia bacterium]|jgi:3-dehydroquinate synthase|nr:3-dehydroquinate synthase [Clostridia bacterium]